MTAIYLRNIEPVDEGVVAKQKRAHETVINGTSFPLAGRAFPVGDLRYAFYYALLPDYVSTPTVQLLWTQTGGTSGGSIAWVAQVAAMSPGDPTRISDKAFAAVNSTSTTCAGDQIYVATSITLTNNDSLAAGDVLIVRVNRDPNVTGCGGTAVLIAVSINYTGV